MTPRHHWFPVAALPSGPFSVAAILAAAFMAAGCASSLSTVPEGSATLAVYTRFADHRAAGFQAQTPGFETQAAGFHAQTAVTPYAEADVKHVVVKLFKLAGDAEEAVNSGASPLLLDVTDYSKPLKFANLKHQTTYRVRAYAYNATGSTDASALISTDTAFVDVAFGTDQRVADATLSIQLIDQWFSGQASPSLAITAGGLAPTGTPTASIVANGTIYTIAGGGSSGDDGANALAAEILAPKGIAFDVADNLYIAQTGSGKIRMIPATAGTFFGKTMEAGKVYTIAGGGSATPSAANPPAGDPLAMDVGTPEQIHVNAQGDLFFGSDKNCHFMLPATAKTAFGASLQANTLYVVAGLYGGAGAASASFAAGAVATGGDYLQGIEGGVADEAGNLLIATAGGLRLVANQAGTVWGTAGAVPGGLYAIVPSISKALGIAPAPDGGAVVAREASNSDWVLFDRIMADGSASPFAQTALYRSYVVMGFAVDGRGLASANKGNQRVFYLVPGASSIAAFGTTIAPEDDNAVIAGGGSNPAQLGDGGSARSAYLGDVGGLAADNAGNLYVSQTALGRIRKVYR